MSCAALVERNPDCTLDDVKAAVSGHLCRCGTYPNIFAATLAAARPRDEVEREGQAPMTTTLPIGHDAAPTSADRGQAQPTAPKQPLRDNRSPTALSGRHGTGDAARAGRRAAAARRERDAAGRSGSGLPRLDAMQKVTGRARYTFDVQLPGMLYARRVVSTVPHARISRSIPRGGAVSRSACGACAGSPAADRAAPRSDR